MILNYMHHSQDNLKALVDTDTGHIQVKKMSGEKALFTLLCRDWKDLENQTKTLAGDWRVKSVSRRDKMI